ncbi:MAG: carboxypeptidase regulatory-like domain-containing protein [Bacteroidota bacterium]
MKFIKMSEAATVFLLGLFAVVPLFSQGTIEGVMHDAESGEPIIFGTVAIYKAGVLYTGSETDFDGLYAINELPEGIYEVLFTYTGHRDLRILKVKVKNKKSTRLDVNITSGLGEKDKQIVSFKKRRINRKRPCCIYAANKPKLQKNQQLRSTKKN